MGLGACPEACSASSIKMEAAASACSINTEAAQEITLVFVTHQLWGVDQIPELQLDGARWKVVVYWSGMGWGWLGGCPLWLGKRSSLSAIVIFANHQHPFLLCCTTFPPTNYSNAWDRKQCTASDGSNTSWWGGYCSNTAMPKLQVQEVRHPCQGERIRREGLSFLAGETCLVLPPPVWAWSGVQIWLELWEQCNRNLDQLFSSRNHHRTTANLSDQIFYESWCHPLFPPTSHKYLVSGSIVVRILESRVWPVLHIYIIQYSIHCNALYNLMSILDIGSEICEWDP